MRAFELGPDPRRALWPAASPPHKTGRTHDRTRPMLQQLRKFLPRRRRPHMTQSGHERAAFAAMHGPDLLYLTRDPWPWGKPHEAARVHRTPRWRGRWMAARCNGAAARTHAADRCTHEPGCRRSGGVGAGRGVLPGAGRLGLDHRTE